MIITQMPNAVRMLIATLLAIVLSANANAESQLYFVHTDHLGTPQVVTDKNQNVVWKGEYTPFGEVKEVVNTLGQNVRFPGQYFDVETGLHYNYFRDYDPTTGRYVQSDPIGLRGGLNTYLYANASPVMNTDRYGLTSIGFDSGSGTVTVDPEQKGRDPYTMPASSGRPNCECDSTTKDKGPIPQGNYNLSKHELSDPGFFGDVARNTKGDWGDWRAPLHPRAGTNTHGRSGFLLHGGAIPGSAGCIDVGGGMTGNAQTDQLLEDILNDPDGNIPVVVK